MTLRFFSLLIFLVAIPLYGVCNKSIERGEAQIFWLESSGELKLTSEFNKPSPQLLKALLLHHRGKKLNAALLAFPFPCGIVGLHRIYLGTAPHVPVVYIATIGGAFGILPFIDFCVLLLEKDIEPYVMNDKVFMWAR